MRFLLHAGLVAATAAALAAGPVEAKDKDTDKNPGKSGGGSTVIVTGGNAPSLSGTCASILSGCVFAENDQAKFADAIAAAYNGQAGAGAPTIESLVFAGKFDGGSAAGLTGASGAWSFGTPVNYVSVKAGNGFVLYALDKPATSGAWSTAALGGKDLSHITFWTGVVKSAQTVGGGGTPSGGGFASSGSGAASNVGAVPEPATWAMMIGGFGLVGWSLRRRAAAVTVRVKA